LHGLDGHVEPSNLGIRNLALWVAQQRPCSAVH
jgi:hypothetical protein